VGDLAGFSVGGFDRTTSGAEAADLSLRDFTAEEADFSLSKLVSFVTVERGGVSLIDRDALGEVEVRFCC